MRGTNEDAAIRRIDRQMTRDKVRVTTEVSVTDVCPNCECTTIHPMADCQDINCACHEINTEHDGTYSIVDYAGE